MFRKLVITITFVLLITFFAYPQRDTLVSVFRMTDEPLVISKGHYGQSLVVEISFSHDGLDSWLQNMKKPYPLLMLDADWIDRAPKSIEIIKKRNIPTGLLGGNGANEYNAEDFAKDMSIYEKHFENKPLWFMTSDYEFQPSLQQAVFKEEVNLLSPSLIYSKDYETTDGAIVVTKLHEKSKPNFKELNALLEKEKFISIEENVFGYSIKTKKLP